MVLRLVIAWWLMALCVAIHAGGMTFALRWLRDRQALAPRCRACTGRFIGVAGWVVLLHLGEIAVWALWYCWKDAMADLSAAFYFSAVSYTTTGYGDLVLPPGVAIGRGGRGPDRHPDVRLVHGVLLRARQPHGFRGHRVDPMSVCLPPDSP